MSIATHVAAWWSALTPKQRALDVLIVVLLTLALAMLAFPGTTVKAAAFVSPGVWAAWGLILFAQNASFTWVSRARNSGSYWYHATASCFSNGVWFVQMAFAVDLFLKILHSHNGILMAWGLLFYTACTVSSSVGMHIFLREHVEKGNRKVGA